MSYSILLYQSENKLLKKNIKKLNEYFNNRKRLTKISKFFESIKEGDFDYSIFRIAKLVTRPRQTYDIDKNNRVVPAEKEFNEWETCFAYLQETSKYIYVKGSTVGWVGDLLSEIMFGQEGKITLRAIDTSKLEEDIRNNAKFRSSGTSFIDADGTKITIRNPAGIDLKEHYITKNKGELEKRHIDILIEKDELTFDIYVYPEGKVTLKGFASNPTLALRVFLKIWSEIESYS